MSTPHRKILLVDDDPSLLVTVGQFLRFEKYEVTTAESGEAALETLKTLRPNLIILDMSMPGMGGIGFLQRITGEDKRPLYPVLVLTARSQMAEFFASVEVDGFMAKPADPDELLQEVARILFQRGGESAWDTPAKMTLDAAPRPVAVTGRDASVYDDRELSTVCKADGDFPRHSEASIIELNDGSLLMAWVRFERSAFGSEDLAPSTVAVMNSTDGGGTWGNFRIVARRDDGCVNVCSPNFLRLKNGDILLLYMKYNVLVPGKPAHSSGYAIRSTDEGETFGAPRTLWQNEWLTPANSCIRRLATGRVIVPLTYTEGELWRPTEKNHARVMFSDDDCQSWTFGKQDITLPMRGAAEPFVSELADGRLIMVMRSQLGSVFKSYSDDRGEHWSAPQPTGLSAPESCPTVTAIPGTSKIMVIWNNAQYDMHFRSHYGKRTPLTAAISADGGQTFTDFWDIETDPATAFSNPGITWTRDGTCLLTYWALPYDKEWAMTGLCDLKLARFRVRV
ncbi:MAG: exo-alpha-sialidase [Kiritimatiellaeota bacterium]|nr:exo-alpha-sialidase [Kiritimatiellota bacterium]